MHGPDDFGNTVAPSGRQIVLICLPIGFDVSDNFRRAENVK